MAKIKKIKKAQGGGTYSPGMRQFGVGFICPDCTQLRLFGKKDDGLTRKERKKEKKEFEERDKEYNDPLRTWKYDKRSPINYRPERTDPSKVATAASNVMAKRGKKIPKIAKKISKTIKKKK